MEKDPLWKRMIVAKYDQASLGDFNFLQKLNLAAARPLGILLLKALTSFIPISAGK